MLDDIILRLTSFFATPAFCCFFTTQTLLHPPHSASPKSTPSLRHCLSALDWPVDHVSQWRNYSLRHRLRPRHPRPRPCLRVRTVCLPALKPNFHLYLDRLCRRRRRSSSCIGPVLAAFPRDRLPLSCMASVPLPPWFSTPCPFSRASALPEPFTHRSNPV